MSQFLPDEPLIENRRQKKDLTGFWETRQVSHLRGQYLFFRLRQVLLHPELDHARDQFQRKWLVEGELHCAF